MEKLQVTPYMRRSRCDVPGCRNMAEHQIGTRPNRPMILLCGDHAMDLYSAMSSGMMKLIKEKKKEEKAEQPAEVQIKEEPKAEAPKKDEEFYICKYCGEKFPKSEMTKQEFMAHCRACKKEHMTDGVSDSK